MRQSIASIALIRREAEGQIFWLAQWNEGWQSYSFVGGHKQHDESFRQCVVREIEEELGLREGVDVFVPSAALHHLEYVDTSRRTGERTFYTIDLFDVALIGSKAAGIVDANPANRWLSEPEIMAERCADGRPVSPTPKRFLNELGWDLFVSYAHKDDQPEGWVDALVRAIRAEHAEFTPTPLRVFFDRNDIRTMDDWQRRIYDGLHASKLMLAVLSENYFRSDYCRREWQLYRDHEVRRRLHGESIAPIYIVTAPGFEGPAEARDEWVADLWQRSDLARRQYLDVRPWRPHGVEALRQNEVRQRLRCLDQQLAERLARARSMSESKTTVPRASDRFVGRTAELARLRELLPQGKVTAITAVQGIGGIGKTALAFLYSQTFADHYPGGRFLVEVAGLDDLRVALVRLAPDLGLTFNDAESRDLDLAASRVRHTLDERARSLLVLDNVDRPELLHLHRRSRVLPAGDRLHVLVTSRMEGDELETSGVEVLPLDPLPDHDGVELLNRHRPIRGDDEWKAALRITRMLGGHALALEVVAVYLWKHSEVTCAAYLARLEAEGLSTALSGTGKDRAVQLSQHPEKLIGRLLEATLATLSETEQRAIEYAALLPPDSIALPWVRELLAEDLPDILLPRPGYPDPWMQVERRLFGLRLWMPTDDSRLARMHRIVQAVVRDRLKPGKLAQLSAATHRLARRRAAAFGEAQVLGEFVWEVELLRDYALVGMSQDVAEAVYVAQWISDPLRSLGRLTDAGILARAAVDCGERLSQADPSNSEWQRDLSISYEQIGNVQTEQGDLAAALVAHRASLAIHERLAAADPSNSEWQRDLCVSHIKIGDAQTAQGDPAAALKSYQVSLAISQRLAATNPSNSVWQRDLSVCHITMGNVESARGKFAAALESYRASLAIRERLTVADPSNSVWQRDLSISHEQIGDVQTEQGDLAAALVSYRASLAIRERLAAADMCNSRWQRDLSISLDRIGDVHRKLRDLTAALASYCASLTIGERLAAADPSNSEWQRDLSINYQSIGDVQSEQGDLTAALVSCRASLAIRERLAAADLSNSVWQRDLWLSYRCLAKLAAATSVDDARRWWKKAYKVQAEMQKRGMFVSRHDRRSLAQLHKQLGM